MPITSLHWQKHKNCGPWSFNPMDPLSPKKTKVPSFLVAKLTALIPVVVLVEWSSTSSLGWDHPLFTWWFVDICWYTCEAVKSCLFQTFPNRKEQEHSPCPKTVQPKFFAATSMVVTLLHLGSRDYGLCYRLEFGINYVVATGQGTIEWWYAFAHRSSSAT